MTRRRRRGGAWNEHAAARSSPTRSRSAASFWARFRGLMGRAVAARPGTASGSAATASTCSSCASRSTRSSWAGRADGGATGPVRPPRPAAVDRDRAARSRRRGRPGAAGGHDRAVPDRARRCRPPRLAPVSLAAHGAGRRRRSGAPHRHSWSALATVAAALLAVVVANDWTRPTDEHAYWLAGPRSPRLARCTTRRRADATVYYYPAAARAASGAVHVRSSPRISSARLDRAPAGACGGSAAAICSPPSP